MELFDTSYAWLESAGLFQNPETSLLLLVVIVLLFLHMLRTILVERSLRREVETLRGLLETAARPDSQADPGEVKKKAAVESLAHRTTVSSGLQKTRTALFSKIREALVSSPQLDASLLDALEAQLIGADIGVKTTSKLLEGLRQNAREHALNEEQVFSVLKSEIKNILQAEEAPALSPQRVSSTDPRVVLIVGVNGVGKTTTIGKIAHQLKSQGAKVLIGACDTFRAAAADQMEIWANRAGVDIVSGEPGSKPATVAYQALHKAKNEEYDVLLLDTAGRLHTRVNLMNELGSVIQIVGRELPGAPHETLLVLDAATGQNALQQARVFDEKCSLTGVVVTKLDGTPKGGMVVSVKTELGVPVRYIGVGESMLDLRPFDAEEFVSALFDASSGGEGTSSLAPKTPSPDAPSQVRRRRRQGA